MALRYAEAIALRANSVLTVTLVNESLLVAAAAATRCSGQLAAQSAAELEGFIATTLRPDTRTQLGVNARIADGDPAEAIQQVARRIRSDLIVVGTHGRTGVGRLFMGSTTLGVLQHTTVPVLAVPWIDDGPATVDVPAWPGERIVAPIELGAEARRDVEAAAAVVQWFGASLLLLHVMKEISAPAWLEGDLSAYERSRVAFASRRIDGLAAVARRRVETETRVVSGRTADEIAALAATERIRLLITTLREGRGWFGARQGSVSYDVLSRAIAPVLACPSQWRPR
jgi:nucleotide-binding universal stress UspA family protein